MAWAVDTTWLFNGDGIWTATANWDNGDPTNNTFNAFIDDGDTPVVVVLNVDRTINDLTIGSDDKLRIENASTLRTDGKVVNSGTIELGGAGPADATLNSAGNITNNANGEIFGHGVITGTVLNHGKVRAAIGTLAMVGGIIDGGSGTIQIDDGATLDLSMASGDSDTDYLVHNGAGLNLGTHNVLVRLDYDNANFGEGNAFNPRANVVGSGQILSDPAFTQTLTGDVTGGATATPSLDMGVVRIGQPGVSKTYFVSAGGTANADLRGALMNNNATYGANINNISVSGSGVTPANFALTTGTSSGYSVLLEGQSGGQGALVNQTVAIVNNFDNVANQVLALSGEVWQPAVPNITPGPLDMGNFHVGDAASAQLSIANDAVPSAFSENLKATVTSNGAPVQVSGGPSVTVVPGGSDNSIGVGVSTTTGGAKSGSVKITRFSSGATGLADLDLGDQTVNVSAGVYRYALPVVNNLDLGDRHVGDPAAGNVAVMNNAVSDLFSESLRVSVADFAPDVSGAGGSVDVAPGGGSGANLTASLNTATAGAKSGSVTYDLTSLAHASGLSDTSLGQQQANVTAKVYNLAVAQVVTSQPVDFSIVHVGDVVAVKPLEIKNNAPAGAFSENLNAAFGPPNADASGGGSVSGLAPQASDGSSLTVGITTGTARFINTNVVVKFTSDGTGLNSLGQTSLPDGDVNVVAQVNNFAVASLLKQAGDGALTMTAANEYKLDLGTVPQNAAAPSATLGIKNDVSALLPADDLAGSFTVIAPDFLVSGDAPFAGVAAGATYDKPIVTLATSTAGMFSGQLVLHPRSTNPSPYSQALPDITINLTGEVTAVPEPAALGLMMLGLTVIASGRRRR